MFSAGWWHDDEADLVRDHDIPWGHTLAWACRIAVLRTDKEPVGIAALTATPIFFRMGSYTGTIARSMVLTLPITSVKSEV